MVPRAYWEFTATKVLVMDWVRDYAPPSLCCFLLAVRHRTTRSCCFLLGVQIEGIKLSDAAQMSEQGLDVIHLVSQRADLALVRDHLLTCRCDCQVDIGIQCSLRQLLE